MEIEILKNRWIKLFQADDSKKMIETGFSQLIEQYAEPHRHYHTLNHIAACLEVFDQLSCSISDNFCIEAALWFHDVIYDPKRHDNEHLSAKYACAFLSKILVPQSEIQKIAYLIELTKHPANPLTDDEKYLVDIDLMILGAENNLYDTYEDLIRNEYSFVPEPLYRKGRKKILTTFLKKTSIYQTHYFVEKYEMKARSNIERVLKTL
jgi:predicted metal-dependent HD superfamily phosphohydrolase